MRSKMETISYFPQEFSFDQSCLQGQSHFETSKHRHAYLLHNKLFKTKITSFDKTQEVWSLTSHHPTHEQQYEIEGGSLNMFASKLQESTMRPNTMGVQARQRLCQISNLNPVAFPIASRRPSNVAAPNTSYMKRRNKRMFGTFQHSPEPQKDKSIPQEPQGPDC